jgi:hypothetical protein
LSYMMKGIPYTRRIPSYSSYTRTVKKTRKSNGRSIFARKIMIQSYICIMIIILCIWFQNSTEKLLQSIISEIRFQVVEQHVSGEDICKSLTDTYDECVQYLQVSD